MNNKELKVLLSELRSFEKETEWVEFKVNNGTEIGQYISAISNSACIHDKEYGYVVFGIDDTTHRIIGTTFSSNQKGKGNEDLIPWLARLLQPRINFDFFNFEVEGKKIVILRIKSTQNTPVKFKGIPYIRIGSSKKKLDDYPEKERSIWTKSPAKTFENEIAAYDLGLDEVLGLINYQSYFELTDSQQPEKKDAILEIFQQEKLIIRKGNNYNVTNLCAILFAKKIENFESLKRKAVRVIIYNGKNKLRTRKEQIGQKGYATGFKGLVDYINDQLPSNEEIGKAFRKEVKMYPELVIRELVANAIIHQNFGETGTSPMVEIFEDRVEITNPGKPLISTMRFIDHIPQSRNEKLAHFMRRINICEERGSGIDKVIFECEHFQLPAPKFIEGDNYTRIIIYSYKTLREMDKEDKIRACYLHSCLKYVSGELMTNQSLRQRFGIAEKNYSMVSRIIAETIKSGQIKDYDPDSKSKKHSKYIPFWV